MAFDVSVEDLFGAGNLASTLAQNERDANTLANTPTNFPYTESYKGSGGINVPGLIETVGVDQAISLFASEMSTRLTNRSTNLDYIAYELKRAAWRYSATDRATADKLADQHSRIENYGGYTGYSVDPIANATDFPAGETPDTGLPAHKETDVRKIIGESEGILTDIDTYIQQGTKWLHDNVTHSGNPEGWSPLEQVVGPLLGNWAELERAGECFNKAGTASEAAAATYKAGNSQLSLTWYGSAADAYQDYGDRLAKAMEWEGPIGRIAEAVLVATSEQAQAAATALLTFLNAKFQEVIIDRGLRTFLETAVTKLAPGVGWFTLLRDIGKWYDLGTDIWNIYQEATAMIEEIEQLLVDANAVLEALQNPKDAVANEIQQRIDTVKEHIDQNKERLELAIDIGRASDVTAVTNAPDQNYTAPTGAAAWEA
ncbi:hypothetical protein [Nocardia cyriacigeorgica]|uniref:hypothetical protein n=3 Tax=Nocardia TaxID=1817 RepID=UPI002454AF94|nr:hypothetical protein [Nocardia cyriacigeorgica]